MTWLDTVSQIPLMKFFGANNIITSYNKCFPLKKVKARNGYFSKPWLSKGLLKSIKRKNILYKRYLCNPSSDRANQYKKYRNKLNCSLRATKRICYAKKLEECKSNMKSTWIVLNELINNKKARVIYKRRLVSMTRKYPIQLRSRTISVCAYFTNIRSNLANSIPPCLTSHLSFPSGGFVNSLCLNQVLSRKLLKFGLVFVQELLQVMTKLL